jgi:hypothetical protein
LRSSQGVGDALGLASSFTSGLVSDLAGGFGNTEL